MVSLASLWLPILVAAVLVFIASSLIHMVLGYHAADYGKLADEDKVMDALRPFNIPPGEYVAPNPTSPGAMRDPEFLAKRKRGPVFMMTVWPAGDIQMGGQLAQWFVFCLVVGLFTAYVATLAQPAGAPYMEVFQITSTVSFIAYGMALWEVSIWYRRKWGTTLRSNIDALIYSLLTGGVFGWLWP
jgi:hypothetical protein